MRFRLQSILRVRGEGKVSWWWWWCVRTWRACDRKPKYDEEWRRRWCARLCVVACDRHVRPQALQISRFVRLLLRTLLPAVAGARCSFFGSRLAFVPPSSPRAAALRRTMNLGAGTMRSRQKKSWWPECKRFFSSTCERNKMVGHFEREKDDQRSGKSAMENGKWGAKMED